MVAGEGASFGERRLMMTRRLFTTDEAFCKVLTDILKRNIYPIVELFSRSAVRKLCSSAQRQPVLFAMMVHKHDIPGDALLQCLGGRKVHGWGSRGDQNATNDDGGIWNLKSCGNNCRCGG